MEASELEREMRLAYERRILAAEIAGVKAEKAMRLAAARIATGFLVGDPHEGVPLRSPMPHEIADAILELPLTLGNETSPAALRSPADVDLSEALKGYVGIASGPCNEGWRTVVFFNDPEKAHALDSLLHNAALSSGESQ